MSAVDAGFSQIRLGSLYCPPIYCAKARQDLTSRTARARCCDILLSNNSSIDNVPDISASTMRPSSPNSLLACIFLVQQVSASYESMRSHISSRRLYSRPESSKPSRSASISSALETSIDKETFEESFCIGDFKVEDLESQCNLLEAVVTVEIKRFREVLTGLEMWARELSKDGKCEGKLAELILRSLANSLPTSSRPSSATGSFEMS